MFSERCFLLEILIKHAAGRLEIESGRVPVERFLLDQREAHGIEPLPLEEAAVLHLVKLPALHRDPFDRVLICQAIAHGLTLVTPDEAICKYPVRILC